MPQKGKGFYDAWISRWHLMNLGNTPKSLKIKKTTVLLVFVVNIFASSCAAFNYKSREEALIACNNWAAEKPYKIMVKSGVFNARECELEVEARRLIGRASNVEQSLKVYDEKFVKERTKAEKHFNY